MLRRDEVTSRARVVELKPGEPAHILLTQRAVRPDGKERTITQKLPVLDPELVARLTVEVGTGDEIEATIVTEWSRSGYSTFLSGFRKTTSSSEAVATTPPLAARHS